MATLGKVDEFDASKEEWLQYEERLAQFFLANDIDNADKKELYSCPLLVLRRTRSSEVYWPRSNPVKRHMMT